MKPILVVEDSEDDIFLLKCACQRSGFPHTLHIVRDGEEAKAYLAGEGSFADRHKHPLPCLVLLDIKMPRTNGHEVAQWIRSQPHFQDMPVVMLTTSDLTKDINHAYAVGANSYLHKSADMVEFGQSVRIMLKYWLTMNVR